MLCYFISSSLINARFMTSAQMILLRRIFVLLDAYFDQVLNLHLSRGAALPSLWIVACFRIVFFGHVCLQCFAFHGLFVYVNFLAGAILFTCLDLNQSLIFSKVTALLLGFAKTECVHP